MGKVWEGCGCCGQSQGRWFGWARLQGLWENGFMRGGRYEFGARCWTLAMTCIVVPWGLITRGGSVGFLMGLIIIESSLEN